MSPRDPMSPSDTNRIPSDTSSQRTQDQNTQNQQNQNQQNQNQNQANDFNQAPTADASGAGGPMSAGANTPFAGRLDMNNRFNLFDNMSALPQSRVWFGYQLAKGQNTGIKYTDPAKAASLPGAIVFDINGYTETLAQTIARTEGLTGDIIDKGAQHGYRVGVEAQLNPYMSVAVQGTYFEPFETEDPVEDFGNPQFLVKHVLVNTDFFVASGTFGITPEVSHEKAVLNDNDTYLYPGVLAYMQLTRDLFVQGATQVSIPTDTKLLSLDWGLSFGYWLYRHESLTTCFNPRAPYAGPFLKGIVPQIEVFGKHQLNNETIRGQFHLNPYAPVSPDDLPLFIQTPLGFTEFDEPIYEYKEPRNVVDMTCATQFVLKGGISVTTGVSFPLTGSRVRDIEFLSSVNFYY